jgi:hypothetical protein
LRDEGGRTGAVGRGQEAARSGAGGGVGGRVPRPLTIARLKSERIADPAKRPSILVEVNGQLWTVEDYLRECESVQEFSSRFIELARSVYRLNDERGALKKALSERLGAPWAKQKQYGSQT